MKNKKPLSIYNNIENTYSRRLDLLYEGGKLVGIHNSDFENVVSDIDKLIKSLLIYRDEMAILYNEKPKAKKSYIFTKIYLAYDDSNGYYKIGRSMDPVLREKTLMAERSTVSFLFISHNVPFSTESELHKKFKPKRIRGEWFNLNEDDISYIKEYINGIA